MTRRTQRLLLGVLLLVPAVVLVATGSGMSQAGLMIWALMVGTAAAPTAVRITCRR
ncbi:hypothetical protein [Nocardioides sp. GY 10113]|uniref:hypothetical protein n=1 Tax=Nocardioides sp. GY 10113 TaxID=2569761 RepID=UPI001458FD37|nr:hypothetical protein [Nocardioides sp. GY 10113]